MAVFSEWQPRYAERGIATFPVRIDANGKSPAVKGYLKLGSAYSKKLTEKFADFDGIGFAVARAGITVVDVDTNDEAVLKAAIARHGPTPIVVRSGSGNFQAWYRNDGERRRVRPNQTEPIDILGHGFVVAPPSKGLVGRYEFIQGGLEDIGVLPKMLPLPFQSAYPNRAEVNLPIQRTSRSWRNEDEGRNDTLWRACMVAARSCKTKEELLDFADSRNAEFSTRLDRAELRKTALSAWSYEERGLNFFSEGQYQAPIVPMHRNEIDSLMYRWPDAFLLLVVLRSLYVCAKEFKVPNDMRERMPGGRWALRRFVDARQVLELSHLISLLRKASSHHGPAIYAWPDPR